MTEIYSEIAKLLQSFDPVFAFSGFLVGTLVGLTGVGGGSLMTPILVLFFGIHPTTAVGTDLIYAAIIGYFDVNPVPAPRIFASFRLLP